jgi:hypothetical protein
MGQTQPPGPDTGPMLYAATAFTGSDRAMPPLAGPTDPSLYADLQVPPALVDGGPIQVRRGGTPWPLNDAERDAFEELNDKKPDSEPEEGSLLAQSILRAFRPPRQPEPDHPTDELPAWADELRLWWIDTATADITGSIRKIAEYGGRGAAYDLIATGHDLAALNGRTVGDEEATELAILFYASSKLNRMMAAAIDGRRGSDDTLLDLAYYAFMARRNRAVGGWPVAPAGE